MSPVRGQTWLDVDGGGKWMRPAPPQASIRKDDDRQLSPTARQVRSRWPRLIQLRAMVGRPTSESATDTVRTRAVPVTCPCGRKPDVNLNLKYVQTDICWAWVCALSWCFGPVQFNGVALAGWTHFLYTRELGDDEPRRLEGKPQRNAGIRSLAGHTTQCG